MQQEENQMGERLESAPTGLAGVQIEGGEGLSRGDLLLKGALAAGALYGLGAVSPYVRSALASEYGDDADILNFLLSFEYLQTSIYNRGNSEVNDKGEKMKLNSKQKQLVETLLAEDAQHVSALKEEIEKLGGKPAAKGEYAFAFRYYNTFLRLSGEIETSSISAYNGAIPALESDEARDLASSIVQVDGRHAATVVMANGADPSPHAFDRGLDKNSAITVVAKFTGIFPEY